nr:hypothetical protein [Tanacetum cinerariifolium]
MCICLKDHLDVQERIQHTSNLEGDCLEIEQQLLEVEVEAGYAINIADEEINLEEQAMSGFATICRHRESHLKTRLLSKTVATISTVVRYGGAKAPLKHEAWPSRYETDQGVGSRRGVKEKQEKDKIGSKPDKNGKLVVAAMVVTTTSPVWSMTVVIMTVVP